MKTRIFATIALTAALASSAAFAGTALSIEETYSSALPNVTRDDYGLGSYYVEATVQPACRLYDLDPLSVVYPEKHDILNDYLVIPQSSHIVCLRESSRG